MRATVTLDDDARLLSDAGAGRFPGPGWVDPLRDDAARRRTRAGTRA